MHMVAPFPFTAETAKINAAKSVAVRREKRLAGEEAIKRLAELERLDKLTTPNERVERLEAQLNEIEGQMLGADADVKSKLATAHAKLFDVWCVLTGTERPGVRRKSRRSERPPTPEPIQPANVVQLSPVSPSVGPPASECNG